MELRLRNRRSFSVQVGRYYAATVRGGVAVGGVDDGGRCPTPQRRPWECARRRQPERGSIQGYRWANHQWNTSGDAGIKRQLARRLGHRCTNVESLEQNTGRCTVPNHIRQEKVIKRRWQNQMQYKSSTQCIQVHALLITNELYCADQHPCHCPKMRADQGKLGCTLSYVNVFLFWATSHYPVHEQHMPPADKGYDNSNERVITPTQPAPHESGQAGQGSLLAKV
uniref:Uncharacterized protein n=1 Tax=Oryza brachyantha TaxID=4533 RepID=J3MQ82_ORYBR